MLAVGGAVTPSKSAIEGWDVAHLHAAATSWTDTATLWEHSFETVHQGALRPGGTDWTGEGADAAGERTFRDLVTVRGAADHLYSAAEVARRGADRLDHLKRMAVAAIEDAEGVGFTVGEDLSLTDTRVFPVGPALDIRQRQAEALAAEIHTRAASLGLADKEVAAGIGAALAPLSEVSFGEAPESGGFAPLDFKQAPGDKPKPKDDIPPPGSDPSAAEQWWDRHTQAEQEALIREHPDEIGHLNGVPLAVRDRALRSVVEADRARVDSVAAQRHVSVDEIKAHPEQFGLTTTDVLRYNQAGRAQEGLGRLAGKTQAPTMLLGYKPEEFGGQGGAVIAIGDLDRAANVSAVVPGTSHSLAEGWLGNADDAANVYNQMQKLGGSNAVIAWMGYDAPDSLTDPRVATTDLARAGGSQLVSDVNGLRSTALVSQHYTVIGHSYGSTTVADAAVMGMKTDDVVLIGSPGTDLARSAADFHLPAGGHVFVGAVSTDPVTHIEALTSTTPWGAGALGADPAVDGFGSTRFTAELGAIGANVNAHSHYYDVGGDSLRSMGLIATGNGDALESNGLTAVHRDGLHLPGGLLQPKALAEQLAGQYADGSLAQSVFRDIAQGDPTKLGRLTGTLGVLAEDIRDDPEFGR